MHHYVKVPDGFETVQVPYTEYRTEYYDEVEEVDNGNGNTSFRRVKRSRQVPETKYRSETRQKFRDQPVYRQWCQYDKYVWRDVTPARTSGGFPAEAVQSLPIPKPNLGRYQRALPLQRTYEVKITYDYKGEPATTETQPKTESEFLSWRPGEKVMVSRRNIGTVKEIKRAESE